MKKEIIYEIIKILWKWSVDGKIDQSSYEDMAIELADMVEKNKQINDNTEIPILDDDGNFQQGAVIRSADGYSVDHDDAHWTVNCPTCERELEYRGYFDSEEINKCNCGTEFKTRRVYLDHDELSYMQ